MVEVGFAPAIRDFAEESTALQALVAYLKDEMQVEVHA